MKRKLTAWALLLILVLASCGGGSSSTPASSAAYSKAEAGMPMSAPAMPAPAMPSEAMMEADGWSGDYAGKTSTAPSYAPDVKMIFRANLEAETTAFETAHAALEELTTKVGGYFEEQSVRSFSSGYRNGSYTVRVPADRFREFLSQMGELCHLVYQNQSAENITELYYDTDARLQTARIKLERLQDLLSKAQDMADIITLESAISDTEYQIESLSGSLRHYDALVGYATVQVELREVRSLTAVEEAPPTFGQQLASAFREGIENFRDGVAELTLFVVSNLPALAVLAVAAVIVVRIIKKRGFRLFKKKKTPPSDNP